MEAPFNRRTFLCQIDSHSMPEIDCRLICAITIDSTEVCDDRPWIGCCRMWRTLIDIDQQWICLDFRPLADEYLDNAAIDGVHYAFTENHFSEKMEKAKGYLVTTIRILWE